jgi:hypothetical protein
MVLDTRVYRGPEIESDHYLVIASICISPQWIQKKSGVLNKEFSFRLELLQDASIKWLFERRVNKLIEEMKEANTIEEEWENIQKILRQAAKESLGMKKKWCRKKIKKMGLEFRSDYKR